MEKDKKIIKEYEGKQIYLVHQEIIPDLFGKRVKNSFWRTLDDKEHFTFECIIPDNYEDLDLETLKMDCISGKSKIEEDGHKQNT